MDPELLNALEPNILAVQAGDRSRFRPIVEVMLPILRAYVAARSLPGMDVDDIVQRTFVEAYKGIGEYQRLPYLRECLSKIKESARELIRRRYEDDLTMNEIAASVGRTAGAVRKELCLARQQLHECVQRKLAREEAHRGGGDS